MDKLILAKIGYSRAFAYLAKQELYGFQKEIDWSLMILNGLNLYTNNINPPELSCFSMSGFSCITSTSSGGSISCNFEIPSYIEVASQITILNY